MNIQNSPAGVRVTGIKRFDLEQTLECGQCFQFARRADGAWHGVADGREAVLHALPDGVWLEGVDAAAFEQFWRRYLDLDRDYDAICTAFLERPALRSSAVLRECVAYAPGIRILQQPAWEALVGFLMSQNNHLARIKGIVQRLCRRFGEPVGEGWAFPAPETLARLEEADLAELRCGWRAAYLLDAARQVADGTLDLEAVAQLPLSEARTQLQRISGVGPKVAECVLLYGMGRLEAFPLDVWMRRAMAQLFEGLTPADFGAYAGIAQQYIFYYCRCHAEQLRQ